MGLSVLGQAIVLVDLQLEIEVFLHGQPVEEVLDELQDVPAGEEGDFLELVLSLVFGHQPGHEGVDDSYDVPYGLCLYPGVLGIALIRVDLGGILLLIYLLLAWLPLSLFIDCPSQHHEESEEDIDVVGLIQPLVDLGQELAEHVGAGFLIELLPVVKLGLLLLGVEYHV